MVKFIVLLAAIAVSTGLRVQAKDSASNLVQEIYHECLSDYSLSCVRPKSFSWLARVAGDDEIKITDDLTIVKNSEAYREDNETENDESRYNKDYRSAMFDSIEKFVSTHTLKVKVPEVLRSAEASEYVPRSLLVGLPSELDMPLSEDSASEGRGIVKKVVIPFLLGLKFKSAVLVPLALALIALKTWKALTLGLISLVLSGAMVIFKFTKPKVVNYEVIHYPQHHVDHHVDHVAPAWDPHAHHHAPYQARSFADAHDMAYTGQM